MEQSRICEDTIEDGKQIEVDKSPCVRFQRQRRESQNGRKRFSLRSSATKSSSNVKYPEDCYSFIALNGPVKDTPQTLKRTLFFLYGLLPWIFQIVLLVLLAYSQTNEVNGTIGETDNPDQDKDGIISLFAKFTPTNSTPIIRVAQVASLTAYVIFPDSSLTDVVRAVQLFPHFSKGGRSVGYMRLSCILRLIQGMTAIIATVLLVLRSSTVVDIILNFTAVNFISDLDDYAFTLAKNGEFSPCLEAEAERVANTNLPPCMFTNRKAKWRCYSWIAGLVAVFLFAMTSSVFAFQDSSNHWVTQLFRVQFQDETGLNQYSGCFNMNTTSSSVQYSRRKYHSMEIGSLNTSFGYCRKDRQWIFFKGNTADPCDAQDEEGLLLARSSKTDTFDISTMFEESWKSVSNEPLDLYFLDFNGAKNETAMREQCLSLGDGVCNQVYNGIGYDFDGGDCCAATCTKSNCGKEGLKSVFGNSGVSGDGYENCADPSMVPITIHLNHMTSSRDPLYTSFYQLSDVPFDSMIDTMIPPGLNLTNDDFNKWIDSLTDDDFNKWMDEEPLNTYISLDCNGKNVMTAYVDYTMVHQSQTVMVEDGAYCSLVVRNTTSLLDDDPIWYIDYTVFHESAEGRVEILSGHSSSVETVNFSRIPECYFRKLRNHDEMDSIYTGRSSSNQAINWLLEVPDPNQQCEDSNFLERYALVTINLAMNPTKLFITRDEQCRWLSVGCDSGNVVSFDMRQQSLTGQFPSEMGFLSNLRTLNLVRNELTSVPTEIGNLLSLQTLDLYYNQLQSLPTEIGNLSSLEYLDLDGNQLTSVPYEIGNLLSLQTLALDNNNLESLPTEIGSLSSLQWLDLSGNELASLPTEIGNLSSLQILLIDSNVILPEEVKALCESPQVDCVRR